MTTRNDINTKRLIEFYPQMVRDGLIENPGEAMAEILRSLGLNPARYNIKFNTPAPTEAEVPLPEPTTMPDSIAPELAAANNPQLDLT